MELRSEEERQLLMFALEKVEVSWNLETAQRDFMTQRLVVEMHQRLKEAGLDVPDPVPPAD